MKIEAFRLKFPIGVNKDKLFDKLCLAQGDQVAVFMDVMNEPGNEPEYSSKEVVVLTNQLGLVTMMRDGDDTLVAFQHRLVDSMEEVAEDFVDVVAEKADEAMRKVIKHECDLEDWEIDHMLIHFKEMVRHTVWEKMSAPKPVRRKKWWQKRLTLQ